VDKHNSIFSTIRRKGDEFLGHEVVAKVESIYGSSRQFKIGDRVVLAELNNCKTFKLDDECFQCASGRPILCENKDKRKLNTKAVFGGWSEFFLRSNWQLVKITENIDDKSAVLIEPAAIALDAVLRSNIVSNDRILIYGSGVIGLIIARLLRIIYGENIVIHAQARHLFQIKKMNQAGVSKVFTSFFIENYAKALNSRVIGIENDKYLNSGYTKIFDCVGSSDSINDLQKIVNSHGEINIIGFGSPVLNLSSSHLLQREIKICGTHGYGVQVFRGGKKNCTYHIIDLLSSGELILCDLLSNTLEYSEYKKAINIAVSHQKQSIKNSQGGVFRVGIVFNEKEF
jgi:threonine dehydrogenase-like Zn-dependent dehydrogenase